MFLASRTCLTMASNGHTATVTGVSELNVSHIQSTDDVYQVVERLESACRKNGTAELLKQIEDAMRVGSSALEILGAVRQTMIVNRSEVEQLLGPSGSKETDEVIAFVDKAFGR